MENKEIVRDKKGRIVRPVGQNTNKNGTAGRPSIVTAQAMLKLEHAFGMGCSDEEACFYADISPRTLYSYQKDNPEFLQKKQLLKKRPIFLARQSTINGFEENPKLAFDYLKAALPEEFHSGSVNLNNTVNQVNIGVEDIKRLDLLKPFLKDNVVLELESSNAQNQSHSAS